MNVSNCKLLIHAALEPVVSSTRVNVCLKKNSQLLGNGIANTRRHIGYHSARNAEDRRLENRRRPDECQAASVDALDDRKARVADCCKHRAGSMGCNRTLRRG